MKSAPSLMSVRTRCRTSSGPSASPPMYQRCPPVTVTGCPATMTLGPATSPWRIPSLREKAVRFQDPASHRVVTPDTNARSTFLADRNSRTSSESLITSSPLRPSPGILVWVWQSISPGKRVAVCRSNTWGLGEPSGPRTGPDGSSVCSAGPHQAMRFPWIATACPWMGGPPCPSMSQPGLMTMSSLGVDVNVRPPLGL